MDQLQPLFDTHNELTMQKQEIEKELKKLNSQINLIVIENQNNCNHHTVNRSRDYDGHTWRTEYMCQICDKRLNSVHSDQIVINL